MPKNNPSDNAPNFEEAMARLDEIVNQMEEEQLPLEDMVRVYEEGVKLLKICRKRIESARARVERINASADNDSDAVLTPFDPEDASDESPPPQTKARRSPAAKPKADEDNSGDDIRLF